MKPTKEQQLQRAKDYAISKGGECLSTEYVTVKAKLLWDCKRDEHPNWEATGEIISRGSWCVLCGREEQVKKSTLSNGLELAHAHAAKEGGWCLSTEYKSAKTKMQWRCRENHTWESDFEHVVTRDRWCQQCAYDRAIIPDAYEQALKYVNSEDKKGSFKFTKSEKIKGHTLIEWKCKKNAHKPWMATFTNVVARGGWCPYCAGKFTRTEYLQMAKAYAINKNPNWTCISEEYVGQSAKLKWKCHEHGEWLESYSGVVDKSGGCRKCRNKLEPEEYLEKAKAYAISQDGECISREYVTQNAKLVWKCHKHGNWESDYANVVSNNRWCPTCFKEKQQQTCLSRAHKYALTLGGECLTNKFNNTQDLFEWRCHDDSHPIWKSKYNTVLGNKTWCPVCGIYYQKENQTRKLLEYLLGYSLEKANPTWNVNPETGKLLELDGYNEQKKVAFEYQGRHHYQENVFKNSNQSLAVIQAKDKVKKEHCKLQGITLLIIDGRKKRDTSSRLIKFLQQILENHNISYKKDVNFDEVEKIYNEARIEKCDNTKKI